MKLKVLFIFALSINLSRTKNILFIHNNENKYVNEEENLNSTSLVNNTNATPFCREPSINEFPNDFVPFKEYHYESYC